MSTSEGKVTVSVEWNGDMVSIALTPRNWRKVTANKPLRIRGKGFVAEGEFDWDYWCFNQVQPGSLEVKYGDDGGLAFEGNIEDATVTLAAGG
jgi:hypothetical protein